MALDEMTNDEAPRKFIHHLAIQSQLLTSLKWLGETGVLACIPLSGSVSTREIADITDVSEQQLTLVVRMTALHDFLHIDESRLVSHTVISSPFVVNLAFQDAILFITDTLVPAASHMGDATRNQESLSAYTIAFSAATSFTTACVDNTRLRRQWAAYRRCINNDAAHENNLMQLLHKLNWQSLGNACIVDTCAHTLTAIMGLAQQYPSLRFVVQTAFPIHQEPGIVEADMKRLAHRAILQQRLPASEQTITDAAVYLLCLEFSPTLLSSHLLAELQVHYNVLRTNASATLVLIVSKGTSLSTGDYEARARDYMRDLSTLQLIRRPEFRVDDVIGMLNGVGDNFGCLTVIYQKRCTQSGMAALAVKYRPLM